MGRFSFLSYSLIFAICWLLGGCDSDVNAPAHESGKQDHQLQSITTHFILENMNATQDPVENLVFTVTNGGTLLSEPASYLAYGDTTTWVGILNPSYVTFKVEWDAGGQHFTRYGPADSTAKDPMEACAYSWGWYMDDHVWVWL
jgi:hypothetical protein